MKNYRFNDAYEEIHVLNGDAYIYLCSYYLANVKASDPDKTKVKKAENFEFGSEI